MLSLQKELSQIFLKEIKNGCMPWQQQHNYAAASGAPLLLPKNLSTGKTFSAINTYLLWIAGRDYGFTSQYWATKEKWEGQNETIAADRNGVKLYHFEDTKRQSLGWTTYVYNRCQLASYDPSAPVQPKLKALSTRIAGVKDFIASTGASFEQRGDYSAYLPASDVITVPPVKSINKRPTPQEEERHCSQLLHSLMHWTGHPSRCNRVMNARLFSKEQLSESLVALIGSSLLHARLGINNAGRIGGCDFIRAMTETMQSDPRFFLLAAEQADQAFDYLTGSFTANAKLIALPAATSRGTNAKKAGQLIHENVSLTAQVIPLKPSPLLPHFRA